MSTNIRDFNWDDFWKDFNENEEKIDDINGVIFRDGKGRWKTVVLIPNSSNVMVIPVYYDPFTGKKLE